LQAGRVRVPSLPSCCGGDEGRGYSPEAAGIASGWPLHALVSSISGLWMGAVWVILDNTVGRY